MKGISGAYRIDRKDDLDFIRQFHAVSPDDLPTGAPSLTGFPAR